MSGCPMHKVRDDLPMLTQRLAALPVDERGYPVPFFVKWLDGKPDHRIADGEKWKICLKASLCWCCGQPLGSYKAFILGPMCTITRTTSEPASHTDCAEWSIKGCPFLSKPQMVRREREKISAIATGGPGILVDYNPGISCIWITKAFRTFDDGTRRRLIEVGDPIVAQWYREGRAATRGEVLPCIESGMSFLLQHCSKESDRKDLKRRTQLVMQHYLPSEKEAA